MDIAAVYIPFISVAGVLPDLDLGVSSEKFFFWFLLGKHIMSWFDAGDYVVRAFKAQGD